MKERPALLNLLLEQRRPFRLIGSVLKVTVSLRFCDEARKNLLGKCIHQLMLVLSGSKLRERTDRA